MRESRDWLVSSVVGDSKASTEMCSSLFVQRTRASHPVPVRTTHAADTNVVVVVSPRSVRGDHIVKKLHYRAHALRIGCEIEKFSAQILICVF